MAAKKDKSATVQVPADEPDDEPVVTAPTNTNIAVPFMDNLAAPDVYASAAAAFSTDEANVTITFASRRFDNSTQPAHQALVAIGRLVIPVSGAIALVADLTNFLRARGLVVMTPVEREKMQ